MATPVIVYNASTGSDTAASGAGPATAKTGTNGSSTISTNTFTLNETVDFTGAGDDGSDVLWVDSTAGKRHLYQITAFVGGVATCTALTVSPVTDEGHSADNWAVGGKRNGFHNDTGNTDLADGVAGWVFEAEDTATFTITTSLVLNGGDRTVGPCTLRAAAGQSPIFDTVTSGVDILKLNGPNTVVDGIKFTSDGTGTQYVVWATGELVVVKNCIIDGGTRGINLSSNSGICIENCEVLNMSTSGIYCAGGRDRIHISRCSIHDNSENGILMSSGSSSANITVERCVIYDNTLDGILDAAMDGSTKMHQYINNTIDNNGSDGIAVSDAPSTSTIAVLINNSITNNGGWGVISTTASKPVFFINRNNLYNNNTSGARSGVDAGDDDSTSAPDYTTTTEGSEDYTPQASSALVDAGAASRTG